MPTTVITNFGGRLTRINNGDINSGYAKYLTTSGNAPFSKPGQLTWYEAPIQIDAAGSVITDLIVAGKERVESGISYVYAIGHTGRLYKIQVNDPITYNPNYDNPVLVTTLTSNSPTFTRGGSMDFYGATEQIYIGHDKGVTKINFDGTSEAFVGSVGTWVQNVPRPFAQFVGKLYVGNGDNIAEIDTTATVTTYGKLSPSFPDNTQVRDLDTSLDGNYLHAVVTRLALPDITVTTQDTTFLSNAESYIFRWNGVDLGYTAYDSFPSFSLNANTIFADFQFTFGYDISGAAVFNPVRKLLTPVFTQAPLPNAVASNGSLIGWGTPEFVQGFQSACHFLYGPLDNEVSTGWWRTFRMSATGSETDVIRIPFHMIVSNFGIGASNNGYFAGVFGSGKFYFSTLEASSAPTTKYKLYRFFATPTNVLPVISGTYETQTQLFSKKQAVKEVRVYGEPWVASNSFTIDIIGSAGTAMTNGSFTFTAGSNINVGDDRCWYNPGIEPTYAVGIRITNLGSTNHTISKIEIDHESAGE